MATSGTIAMETNDTSWSARLKWSSSTNVSTLKSTVSYQIQIYRDIAGTTANTSKYSGYMDNRSDSGSVLHAVEFADRNITVNPRTWTTIYSNSFTVSHNSITGKASTIWLDGTFSGANGIAGYIVRGSNIVLNTINRKPVISSAENFNDEENPTITYSIPNPSYTTLLEACISFDGSKDDIPYRDISKNATSYTFDFTDAEREILRNAVLNGSNKRTAYFYIRYTYNGSTTTTRLGKTLTIINAEPELHTFLLDTNDKTTALTGDSLASLIKGYSNVSYEMSASGKKGASIVSYSAVNGGSTLTTSSGTFNGVNDSTFKLSVTDNRGLTSTREFTLNMVDYFKPTCNQKAKIEMSGETTATITIDVEGEWSSRHFGAVHNALRVECRYRTGSGEWSAWEGADYISDNNTYKITYTKKGLLYSNTYTVQSRAVDLLDEAITGEYTLQLIPVFDWSQEDFNFNVPVTIKGDLTVEGDLITGSGSAPVDYIVDQGTEAMGSNGTWYWEKWSSGKAVCWGVRNFGNMAINKAWGSMYESASFTQDFPTDLFIDIPYFIIHCVRAGGAVFVEQGWNTTTPPTAANTGTFCCYRPTSMTVAQVYLGFYAIGRWK